MIHSEDFTKWSSLLLAETFGVTETEFGYYLDSGQDGLLGTISLLSAEAASAALTPQEPSIASHCGHVLFLLRLFEAYEKGQAPSADWPGSWSTQNVNEKEWEALQGELVTGYHTVMQHLLENEAWPEPRLAAMMVLLTHCAFHVGQIRQLITATSRQAGGTQPEK